VDKALPLLTEAVLLAQNFPTHNLKVKQDNNAIMWLCDSHEKRIVQFFSLTYWVP
jgi:hypothetical protein